LTGRFDLDSVRRRLLHPHPPESKEGPPIAAVAVIINPNDRGGTVLLIKRTEREGDPWSDQVGFPGGHKSSEDRDFLQTAIREAREEVGINLSEHELLGSLPPVVALSHRVQVTPFVFALRRAATVHPNREVAETFWVPLATLQEIRISRRRVRVAEGEFDVEAYVYDGHVIWGLTFRIINLLIDKKVDL